MNKKYILGLLSNIILTVLGIAATAANIFTSKSIAVADFAYLVVYIGVLYYSIIGYKKPHGNLLKYLMLLYVASLLILIYSLIENNTQANTNVFVISYTIVIIGFSYCAGRLNKIKQNQIIFIALLAVLVFALIFTIICAGKPSVAGVANEMPAVGMSKNPPAQGENNSFLNLIHLVPRFSPLIIALDLIGSYFVRYAEHKEAGIMDSKDYNK